MDLVFSLKKEKQVWQSKEPHRKQSELLIKFSQMMIDLFPQIWENIQEKERYLEWADKRGFARGIFRVEWNFISKDGCFIMQKGKILKELRKDKKMTQGDVAVILKTSRQYYSDYECEKYELPLHHLELLSEFFHVSTDYLLGKTPIKIPYKRLKAE